MPDKVVKMFAFGATKDLWKIAISAAYFTSNIQENFDKTFHAKLVYIFPRSLIRIFNLQLLYPNPTNEKPSLYKIYMKSSYSFRHARNYFKKILVIFITDELQPLRTDENSSKIYNTYDQLRQQNRMDYERQRRMPSQSAPQPEQPLQRPSSHHEPPRMYKTFLTVFTCKGVLCYAPVLLSWFKLHGVST